MEAPLPGVQRAATLPEFAPAAIVPRPVVAPAKTSLAVRHLSERTGLVYGHEMCWGRRIQTETASREGIPTNRQRRWCAN
jgi:hypothetical protein